MAHLRPSKRRGILLATLLLACCAGVRAQVPLPDPDGAAKLLSFTGQLSVVRSGYAWALNTGDAIKPLEVVVTGPDGWGVFQVADGSKFEVYPNSKVVFRANRGDWRDLLEVMLGKIRVQIEHFGGLPNNNQVRTPTAVISVRGTIFTIEVDDSRTTFVMDEEGVVVVRHLLRPSETILKQGESVRVYENTPIGKAVFDKGGIMQRVAQAARDALYQAAVNEHGTSASGVSTASGSGTGTADKNNGGVTNGTGSASTPPPAPTPAPPPPH
jgi:hypothetical protein